MDLYPEIVVISDRIALRPLAAGDAAGIAAGLSDWAVTAWLTHVPFPYALSDAEWFVRADVSRGAMAIIVDGGFAGAVHIGRNGMLGYWLAQPSRAGHYDPCGRGAGARAFRQGSATTDIRLSRW
jgi:hypothetical protein